MSAVKRETPPRPALSVTVSDARLQQSKDKTEAKVSGVFEGTAGTGGEVRFIPADEEGKEPISFEFFQDKEFHPEPEQNGYTVNRYLGAESRSGFAAFADDDDELHGLQQLEALSKLRRRADLETPVDRITRLQREISEMIAFIKNYMESRKAEIKRIEAAVAIPAASGETSMDSDRQQRLRAYVLEEGRRLFGADPDVLLKELDGLSNCLTEIAASDMFHAAPSATAEGAVEAKSRPSAELRPAIGGTAAAVDFIKSQLEAVEALAKKASDKPKVGEQQQQQQPFTFEVYSVPSAKDAIDATRILELEKRLSELEAQLGISKGGQFNLPFSDVSSVLREIVSRLSLLHPSRIEGLTKRFQTLGVQVDELIHRRERLAAAAQAQKLGGASATAADGQTAWNKQRSINNLYDFCESTRPAAAALPSIVKRLKALKVLHHEGASLTSRLTALEAQQSDLATLLNTTQKHFDDLRDSVQQNIAWAKEIVKDLEKFETKEK